jgi:prepilin-type N-terminal cleavage/methylation domain-containing protein
MIRVPAALRRADGFTLPEVIVVTVLLGVLCAIAVPQLLGQRGKAQDADAKVLARVGAQAMQVYEIQKGDYAATKADLGDVTPELAQATNWTLATTTTSYEVKVTSGTGTVFKVERASPTSPIVRTCSPAPSKGCPADGSW